MIKLLITILMLNISVIVASQSIKDHIDRSKVVNRFNNNQNLKLSRSVQENIILQFVYDSTNNELFKITESNISGKGSQREYCFNNEQLYYSKTEVGINYFFNPDFYFNNPIKGKDERLYTHRENIISRSYRCILAFRNYISISQR